MIESITQNLPMLLKGTGETLYMTFLSIIFAYVLGLPLGVLLIVTGPKGIRPMPRFNAALSWVINIGRSIPFIILMIVLLPLAQLITGSLIGPNTAVVALVVASAPFVARMVESSLAELDQGVVEAALTMGATHWEIIWKVLLPEAIPSLVRGLSITTITLIGYSAMAGAIGAGGLGDIAIRYGVHRYQYDVMMMTVVLLIIIVQVLQSVLDALARRIDKRNLQ